MKKRLLSQPFLSFSLFCYVFPEYSQLTLM